MCKERIRLSGEWELYYCRESEFGALGFDGGEAGLVALPKLKATVPGCFEKDFSEAGVLPKDLFYSTNILLLQNYEDLHLFYVKTFASDLTRGN
jgi:hypothetical protein